jgi:hypothetical protein
MVKFKFDHTGLSLSDLQSVNIRSTKWLEQSFYDTFSRVIEITHPLDPSSVYVSFGFCDTMIPILYVFELDSKSDDVILRSLYARVMTREDIKTFYCGH